MERGDSIPKILRHFRIIDFAFKKNSMSGSHLMSTGDVAFEELADIYYSILQW